MKDKAEMKRADQKEPDQKETENENLLCPITCEPMEDPVVAADGHTYERKAIERWISTRGGRALSPMTGERLANLTLRPNFTLRKVIQDQPDLERRQLQEKDLTLAIKLRQKELEGMLKKRDLQLRTEQQHSSQQEDKLTAENNALRQRLEHSERLRLKFAQENKRLKAAPVAEAKNLSALNPELAHQVAELSGLEQEFSDLQRHQSANKIKKAIASKILRKVLKRTNLYKRNGELQHALEQTRTSLAALGTELTEQLRRHDSEYKTELSRNKEHYNASIQSAAQQQDWKSVGKLSQEAEIKQTELEKKGASQRGLIEQKNLEGRGQLTKQERGLTQRLKDLQAARVDKYSEILGRTEKIAQFDTQERKQESRLVKIVKQQKKCATVQTTFFTQRELNVQQRTSKEEKLLSSRQQERRRIQAAKEAEERRRIQAAREADERRRVQAAREAKERRRIQAAREAKKREKKQVKANRALIQACAKGDHTEFKRLIAEEKADTHWFDGAQPKNTKNNSCFVAALHGLSPECIKQVWGGAQRGDMIQLDLHQETTWSEAFGEQARIVSPLKELYFPDLDMRRPGRARPTLVDKPPMDTRTYFTMRVQWQCGVAPGAVKSAAVALCSCWSQWSSALTAAGAAPTESHHSAPRP